MQATIEALCAELNNYHDTDRIQGTFTIESGSISLPFLSENQFFRIVGSKWNDGVYIYSPESWIVRSSTWEEVMNGNLNWGELRSKNWGDLVESELIDETFTGAIWPMRMPRAFLDLSKKIAEYNESDAAKPSPFLSESISGYYSYTKASAESTEWQTVFNSELKRWRKTRSCL